MKRNHSIATLALALAAFLLSSEASAQNCAPMCQPGEVCLSDGTCSGNPAGDGAAVEVQGTAQPVEVVEQPAVFQPAPATEPPPATPPPANVGYAPQQGAQAAPSLAHPGSLRLKLGFLLGLGGRQTVTVESGGTESDFAESLAPSFGFELDFEKLFGRIFFSSATLRYSSLDLGGDGGRFGVYGLDVGLGFHYAFDAGPIAIDPFFSAHVGFGVGSNGEYGAFGLAVALKLGASLWFHRMIGAYVAVGYRGSAFFSGARAGASGSSLRQATMDFGVNFRFGH